MAKTNGVTYTVILQAEQDSEFVGYYNASVPALPGCFSYGSSREDALANIKEAIEVYLEDMQAMGEALPIERIEAVGVEV